jgi:hypothetical protein
MAGASLAGLPGGVDSAVPTQIPLRPLVEELSPEFLAAISWDWQERVVTFPAEHPLFRDRHRRRNGG